MRICISSGHGKYVRGASGPSPWGLDEVDEARRVVDGVVGYWIENGVAAEYFHDNTSVTQSQNLQTIVNYHNAQERDLDVSVHFNAYKVTPNPRGVEVLYITQYELAEKVSLAIADTGDFINRGAKKRTDLYFLNETKMPAILIETCFVDSHADADLYRQNFNAICRAIATSIADIEITEPPEEPTNPEVPSVPLFAPNHTNIICTVFGGADDPNDSAYPPYDNITDQEISCALPYKWPDKRPTVFALNPDNGKSAILEIRDVGPWLTDDEAYVLGDARPLAETSPIPRGPHEGEESNGAGIDITPAAAEELGIDGKGTVHWRFIS